MSAKALILSLLLQINEVIFFPVKEKDCSIEGVLLLFPTVFLPLLELQLRVSLRVGKGLSSERIFPLSKGLFTAEREDEWVMERFVGSEMNTSRKEKEMNRLQPIFLIFFSSSFLSASLLSLLSTHSSLFLCSSFTETQANCLFCLGCRLFWSSIRSFFRLSFS